jgi:hypothetical protein
VSGVVSLQKPRDRAEHRAFQHLLKSTPLDSRPPRCCG